MGSRSRLYGREMLQYNSTEGLPELRAFIAERYKKRQGLSIRPENVLITSGSQQGLDLLGKAILNDGDGVIIEEPGYVGAIQSLSLFQPHFKPVPVVENGIDTVALKSVLEGGKSKLMYAVPNFQNPSGNSYSEQNRQAAARMLSDANVLLVEDDPYGEIRFSGQEKPSFKALMPEHAVLLGSFSKTIAPGLRLGWIVAPDALMEKLIIAKQACDLHTSSFSQRVALQYLLDNDLDKHISKIVRKYASQKQAMTDGMGQHFPSGVVRTSPEGGMFLWATLPAGYSSMELFRIAAKDNVAFVPGHPFYIGKQETNTLRLSFACVDGATIKDGMQRLGKAIQRLYETSPPLRPTAQILPRAEEIKTSTP